MSNVHEITIPTIGFEKKLIKRPPDRSILPKVRRIYIAGKFSAPTREGVELNIARAIDAGILVCSLGFAPVIPHANTSDPRFETLQAYPFCAERLARVKRLCR